MLLGRLNTYSFVWITLGLIGGIVFASALPQMSSVFLLMVLTFVSFILVKSKIEWKVLPLVFIFTLFFNVGLELVGKKEGLSNPANFINTYTEGDIYLGKVKSISSSTKTWNKAILQVEGIYKNQKVQPIDETVLLMVHKDVADLERGDELFCQAHLFRIANKKNPGEFNSELFWRSKGITQMGFLSESEYRIFGHEQNVLIAWFNKMDKSLSSLFENALHEEAVGVAKAIILGDRDHLDAESLRSFGNAGAMHVLAVSGLHVGLILTLLIYFFSRFPRWISKYKATIMALLIIWFYALLTGFSPSVFRAVVMFSLLTIAKLSGRNYNSINVLAASAFILLLYDPLMIYDLGFQLSYSAMLGIFLVYPVIQKVFYFKFRVFRWLWEGTSVALAAQLFTFPLTLYCFHQFPNYFLLSNIGLMVFTNVILIVGVLFIVLHKLPLLNIGLAWTLSFLVVGMFVFVQWIDHLPASVAKGFVFPFEVLLLLYLILGVAIALANSKLRWRNSGLTLLVLSVCSFLVYARTDRNSTNEFVIFNDNQVTMLLKYENKLYCFFENDDYISRAMYLTETYEKTRSGEIEYIKLQNEKETFLKGNQLDFRCSFKESHYDLSINGKKIQLTKYFNSRVPLNKSVQEIQMPWMNETIKSAFQLKNGAFVLGI